MDIFCKTCSSKAGPEWVWNPDKVINHSCQRCYQMQPCNDFSWKTGRVKTSGAPAPRDLVQKPKEGHIDVQLPKAKGQQEAPPKVAPKPQSVDGENETDRMINQLQPNRPGVKLETRKR